MATLIAFVDLAVNILCRILPPAARWYTLRSQRIAQEQQAMCERITARCRDHDRVRIPEEVRRTHEWMLEGCRRQPRPPAFRVRI